jgi:YD repeat-containing protein
MPSKLRQQLFGIVALSAFLFASVIASYAESINYVYDNLNRLTRVEYESGTVIVYTYDEVGNRLEETIQVNSGCNYSINPVGQSFEAAGGSSSVSVTASSGCSWSAGSIESWITITSGGSGNGNGTVNYSLIPNTSISYRTGTMTIAGKSFLVNQAGVPSQYPPVRTTGTNPNYYSTLQDAYNAAVNGNIIQAQALTLIGNLISNRNISVTVEGGYTGDYGTNAGGITRLIGMVQRSPAAEP